MGTILELLEEADRVLARHVVPIAKDLQPEVAKLPVKRQADLRQPSPLATWAAQQRRRLRNTKAKRRTRRKVTRAHQKRLRARKR